MRTIPSPATPIPSADAPREDYVDARLTMQQHLPVRLSGHPLHRPCGMIGRAPIGLMLVGRHFDEPR